LFVLYDIVYFCVSFLGGAPFHTPSLLSHSKKTLHQQVGVSSLAFAAAHPSALVAPELLIGAVFGAAFVAAEGNLLVPTLAHSLYNALVLGVAYAAASGGGGGGGGGAG
jgi:hypothetical protein